MATPDTRPDLLTCTRALAAACTHPQGVVGVRLESAAPFSLTEVGVNTGRCVEQATVDMGELKPVGVLR